jgi:hypothetical protein
MTLLSGLRVKAADRWDIIFAPSDSIVACDHCPYHRATNEQLAYNH